MATGRTDRSTKALHNFTMPRELRWGNQKHLRCMKVNSDGRIAPLSRSSAVGSYSSDRRREDPVKHRRSVGDGERGREKDEYPKFLHGSHGLRCASPSTTPYSGRRFCDGGGDGIAALREKVMFDLRTEVNTMKYSIFKDGLRGGSLLAARGLEGGSPSPTAEGGGPRTSLTASGTTVRFGPSLDGDGGGENVSAGGTTVRSGSSLNGDGGGENDNAGVGKGLTVDALKPDSGFSQMRAVGSAADKLLRLRSGGGRAAIAEKRERPKFSVALSKSEIEEDFFGMTGHRPARRPKKRARNVQRQLNTLFPGLWLTEITADMYKVVEAVPTRQKW